MLANTRASSNHGASSDAGKGRNRDIWRDLGKRVDKRAWMDGGREFGPVVPFPELCDACKIMVGIINNDACATLDGRVFSGRPNHNTRRH